uniref:Nup54 domain-containing protein n=1 Tax=Rhabditophanes sp. KR3021 TaxID=114890 RepID=A0AC35UBG1_9BILA
MFGNASLPASGGLFNTKPAAGPALFGSTQANTTTTSNLLNTKSISKPVTMNDIVQGSESLVQSLTNPELFGDKRDEIVSKLNQICAAAGVSKGYYKNGANPVEYTPQGIFYRFKSVGYNRQPNFKDSDGMIGMVIQATLEAMSSSERKQKFLDILYIILGSKPTLHAHLEGMRTLNETCIEIVLYVKEKGMGRIGAKELTKYFNQDPQMKQLREQLCCERVVAKSQVSEQELNNYLKLTPPGFDANFWQQCLSENPDPTVFIPYPIRGHNELCDRQTLQVNEVNHQEDSIVDLRTRLHSVQNEVAQMQNEYNAFRQTKKHLSHRLLKLLATQTLMHKFGRTIDSDDERLNAKLEMISAHLNTTGQIKDKVVDILRKVETNTDVWKDQKIALQRQKRETLNANLHSEDASKIKIYLTRCKHSLDEYCAALEKSQSELSILNSGH